MRCAFDLFRYSIPRWQKKIRLRSKDAFAHNIDAQTLIVYKCAFRTTGVIRRLDAFEFFN